MENQLLQELSWLWIPLVWLALASIVLLVVMLRGLPQARWLLLAFLLAPLAVVACILPRRWLLALSLATPETQRPRGPELKIPPEKLLAGKALVGEVRELRGSGRLPEAADLLEVLIDVAEETAARADSDVPFWYYEELARICHSLKDSKRERKTVQRFLARTTNRKPTVTERFQRRLDQL